MTPDTFDFLKSWWWLITIAIGIIVGFYRYSVKIHKATEELKRVGQHDKDITEIRKKTEVIEEETVGLREEFTKMRKSLDDHVADQKADISVMMSTLFSVLDHLKRIGGDNLTDVEKAHYDLRRRTLEK